VAASDTGIIGPMFDMIGNTSCCQGVVNGDGGTWGDDDDDDIVSIGACQEFANH
jgi:hypothetical protein